MATLKHDDPKALAKRMYWLAWQACGSASGMGIFQERDGVTEEDVWTRILDGGHDTTMSITERLTSLKPIKKDDANLHRLYADYLFGRMMKCDVRVVNVGGPLGEGEVFFPDDSVHAVTPDYQAWASTYPTYQKLAAAAVLDLEKA